MEKSLIEIAAEIIKAQASQKIRFANGITLALDKTFEALRGIRAIRERGETAEEKDELRALRAEPIKSIPKN